jgi:uncharacterized protein YukE
MPDGSGYTMDPDAVKDGAGKFGPVADQLDDATTALTNAIHSLGNCWGDDDSGKEFAKDYVPGSQQAVDAFGSLAESIRGMQKNITDGAAAHQNTNEAAKNTISGKGP